MCKANQWLFYYLPAHPTAYLDTFGARLCPRHFKVMLQMIDMMMIDPTYKRLGSRVAGLLLNAGPPLDMVLPQNNPNPMLPLSLSAAI